jgi:phosphomannomutase
MIKFGTSGHRGIMGKDFSIRHVEAIAFALADYLKSNKNENHLIIGYDPRKGNAINDQAAYTRTMANVLGAQGIKTDVFDDYVPTPLISWYIVKNKLDGGAIFTASHNPKEYNGVKFNPANGAPAPTSLTSVIEDKANEYYKDLPKINVQIVNIVEAKKAIADFATDLLSNCNKYTQLALNSLQELRVAIDAKHGTTAKVWQQLAAILGITNYEILHGEARSDFGHIETNPTKEKALVDLKTLIKKNEAHLGIAHDPDGDRFVILDEQGIKLTPEETTVLILDYFRQKNAPITGIATTLASSRIIKQACDRYKLRFFETAIGFKYFAPYFEAAKEKDELIFAVESSGGFSTSFHTMEKCGFLPCVLILSMLKDYKKPLSQIKKEVLSLYPQNCFKEIEYHFEAEKRAAYVNLFKTALKEKLQAAFQLEIADLNKTDGLKIVFNNADWVLLRLSGTEPLIRIYAESETSKTAQKLLENASILLS